MFLEVMVLSSVSEGQFLGGGSCRCLLCDPPVLRECERSISLQTVRVQLPALLHRPVRCASLDF